MKKRFLVSPKGPRVHSFFSVIDNLVPDYPEEQRENIKLVFEEIFVNIADYAYKGKIKWALITFTREQDYLQIRFVDGGIPFNPLDKEDPDMENITEPGGFGIFFIKKLADKSLYRRFLGSNILLVKFVKM